MPPPELSAVPEPSRSRAVLIGASRYAHGDFPDLPGVLGNLTGLAAFLTSPRGWNLRPEHCSVIGDPEGPDAVMRGLGAAAGEAEDTLLVYFAGHGRLDRTADGTGEGLCWALGGSSANDVYVTGVAYRQVRRLLTDSNVRRVVVVVDCCYSGWAGELLPAVPDDGDYAITGVYVLTACAANDLAMAPPGAERTAFTGTLLRVLENGVPEGPDLLDLGTVVDRLRAELPAGYPRPQCVATNTVMRLAFARNPASPAAGRAGADPGRLTVGRADPVANAGTTGRAGAGPGADPTANGIAGTDEATQDGAGTGNAPAPDVLPERRPARQVRAAPVDGPRSGRVGPLVFGTEPAGVPLRGLGFGPGGTLLASSPDGLLRRWSLAEGRELPGHRMEGAGPDGRRPGLAARTLARLVPPLGRFTCSEFSEVVTCSGKRGFPPGLRLVRFTGGGPETAGTVRLNILEAGCWYQGGDTLVFQSGVARFDTRSAIDGRRLDSFTIDCRADDLLKSCNAAIDARGRLLALTNGREVIVYRLGIESRRDAEILRFAVPSVLYETRLLALSPDGTKVAYAAPRRAGVRDIATGEVLMERTLTDRSLADRMFLQVSGGIVCTPAGHLLWCHGDETRRVLPDRNLLLVPRADGSPHTCLALNADATLLAAADAAGRVRVWEWLD